MKRYLKPIAAFLGACVLGLGLTVSPVATQTANLVFGSSSGTAQVVNATSNALWVSIQSIASAISISINNITTVSTNALTLQNTTAATSGVPVQQSPRLQWCGTAWNSVGTVSQTDCFLAEVLPATAAGTTNATWRLGATIAGGGITYPMTVNSATGNLVVTGGVVAGSGQSFGASSSFFLTGVSSGIFKVQNDAANAGVDFNVATDGHFLISSRSAAATQLATAQTTAPTCTTNCGSPGNVCVGSDSDMVCTMGTTPASAFVVVFNGTWSAAPACLVQSALTSMVVGKMPIAVQTTTGQLTVTTNGTAPVAADKYAIHCRGTQ